MWLSPHGVAHAGARTRQRTGFIATIAPRCAQQRQHVEVASLSPCQTGATLDPMKRALPSQQCKAKAKRSGEQCKRMVVGAPVCVMHGQNARVKAKRLERITMAQALAADERRAPHEVLAGVLHQSEYLLRRMQEETYPDQLTARALERLVARVEQAGRWASKALEAGVNEHTVRLAEKQGELVADCIQRILDALMLSDVQWARVGTVVPAELRRLTAIPS